MDGNDDRHIWLPEHRRQLKNVRNYKRLVITSLKKYKHIVFTSLLVVAILALLFAIASQLRPPSTSSVPNGVTAIDYSTFTQQVKDGNVLAVILQGDAVNALLATPLSQQPPAQAVAHTSHNTQADIATWSRYVDAGYPSWPGAQNPAPIDPSRAIYTRMPAGGDAGLTQLLLSHHVVVSTLPPAQQPFWLALLWRAIPILLIMFILLLILAPKSGPRSMRFVDDRISQFAKSRVRRFERKKENTEQRPKPADEKPPLPKSSTVTTPAKPAASTEPPVTFADVAGIDEVRDELEEIVRFLRSPEYFNRLGARIPRGALLVGPPGTGKTLLARAVAGEAGAPFFSMSASEFVEMFVGVGASRVRDLFNQARQSAPCVVFIDELDAVGRKRSLRISSNDERDQTLNQLLVELDGFDSRKAVVVLAATNRVDILDKALLRPGRFDRHITVSLPDRAGREAILRVHTRRTPLHEDVSLERIARMTTGMSGADLANLVNEAALCAARRNLDYITQDCFEEALARVQLGAQRAIVMSEAERRIIAYHEGGHALVAYHLPLADTVNRVTILPRGQSLGVTQFTAEEDRYNYSRETLMARIAVGLGGRVAEELTFGPDKVTTGAENDFQVVTDLARRMVTRWGMSEQLGVVFADYESSPLSLGMRRVDPASISGQPRGLVTDEGGHVRLNGGDDATDQSMFAMSMPATQNMASSVAMAVLIDAEVRRIIHEGYEMARAILTEHNDQLVKIANALMEHEQLDRKQFEALLME